MQKKSLETFFYSVGGLIAMVLILVAANFILAGVRKRVDVTGVYPNSVVEKAFGVRATTRDWPTMEKIAALLD